MAHSSRRNSSVPHPEDARRVQLELTAKGRRLTAPGVGAIESAVKRVLARYDAAEVQATRVLLTALAEGLESPQGSKPTP
jgi:DNA-binding MarR family transcriptional regulator